MLRIQRFLATNLSTDCVIVDIGENTRQYNRKACTTHFPNNKICSVWNYKYSESGINLQQKRAAPIILNSI